MKVYPIQEATNTDLLQIKEIFFLTTAITNFESEDEKEEFFQKYLGTYLKGYPGFFLKDLEVLGYIVGDTQSDAWTKVHPYLSIFSDLFSKYPAHLHINLHTKAQGMGGGSQLLKAFEEELKAK